MAFHVYPDEFENNRDHPLSVPPGESTGLKAIGTLPETGSTVIRIAWISGGPDPTLTLKVDGGDETPVPIDGMTHPVMTGPAGGGIDAGDALLDQPVEGVYRLRIFLHATANWAISFRNNDAVPHALTWVVADSEDDSKQPWIHAAVSTASHANLEFETGVGKHEEKQLKISNFGTGGATISGITPAISSPFTLSGLPAAVPPVAKVRTTVTVGFDAPNEPGETPLTQHTLVAIDKTDPGPFGTGHNNTIQLHGRATAPDPPPPRPDFDPPEFSPTSQHEGKLVTLNGFNFDIPGLVVLIGEKQAPVTFKTATKIVCVVPKMGGVISDGVFITVKTQAGTATTTKQLLILS